MKHTATLDAAESVYLCDAKRVANLDMFEATIFAYGTFSGNTVTIQASPDGGNTLITLRDVAGTVVSITEDDVYNIRLGNGNKNTDKISLYATMTGVGVSPDVTIDVFDNH